MKIKNLDAAPIIVYFHGWQGFKESEEYKSKKALTARTNTARTNTARTNTARTNTARTNTARTNESVEKEAGGSEKVKKLKEYYGSLGKSVEWKVAEEGGEMNPAGAAVGGEIVRAPKLNYEKEGQTLENVLADIEKILQDCEMDRVVFVGTSLGGYVAYRAQERFGSPAVIINPSCNPKKTVGVDFPEITKEEVWKNLNPKVVLLSRDDDVINPEIAAKVFEKRAQIEWFNGLGHRFGNIEIIIKYIEEIYNQSIHLP